MTLLQTHKAGLIADYNFVKIADYNFVKIPKSAVTVLHIMF